MANRVRLGSALATALLMLSIVAGCGGGDDDDDGNGAPENGSGNGDTATGELTTEAREIYDRLDCAECHGPNGEGDGENPRLTLAGHSLIIQQFRTRTRNGKGEQMPAYSEEEISDEEIEILFEAFAEQ